MTSSRDHAELETRLRAMFAARTAVLSVPEREPADATSLLSPLARRRRAPLLALGAMAAAVAVSVVIVWATPASRLEVRGRHVAGAPASPASGDQPFTAETDQVSMTAESVAIEVGGRTFSTAPPIDVHSDPGTWNQYTTLELTWREHGVEMRLYAYFRSDGRDWWAEELRTYDGSAQGEWVYYKGDFFHRPLGVAFDGDFEATGTGEGSGKEGAMTGRLLLSHLHLLAFRRPAVCTNPTSHYGLVPSESTVRMDLSPNSGYGIRVELFDTATCEPVQNAANYRYRWTPADPTVVTVRADGQRADLGALRAGQTVVHVTATDPGDGRVVAQADVGVTTAA